MPALLDTASIAEVLASPLIQSLRGQEAKVLRKEAELSQEYGRKHPRMINIRSELKNIRSKIAAEVDRVIQGLKNEASVSRTRELSFAASIRELKEIVDEMLDEIPEEQRLTFTLHHSGGLTLSEVAEVMDTTTPTAKSRLRLAREKLQRKLKAFGVRDPHDRQQNPNDECRVSKE